MLRESLRGTDQQQSQMFSYLSPEQRVRQDHPLRAIRAMVDEILRALSPQFDRLYAREGRPSIAPEKLLRALILQLDFRLSNSSDFRAAQTNSRPECLFGSRFHACALVVGETPLGNQLQLLIFPGNSKLTNYSAMR